MSGDEQDVAGSHTPLLAQGARHPHPAAAARQKGTTRNTQGRGIRSTRHAGDDVVDLPLFLEDNGAGRGHDYTRRRHHEDVNEQPARVTRTNVLLWVLLVTLAVQLPLYFLWRRTRGFEHQLVLSAVNAPCPHAAHTATAHDGVRYAHHSRPPRDDHDHTHSRAHARGGGHSKGAGTRTNDGGASHPPAPWEIDEALESASVAAHARSALVGAAQSNPLRCNLTALFPASKGTAQVHLMACGGGDVTHAHDVGRPQLTLYATAEHINTNDRPTVLRHSWFPHAPPPGNEQQATPCVAVLVHTHTLQQGSHAVRGFLASVQRALPNIVLLLFVHSGGHVRAGGEHANTAVATAIQQLRTVERVRVLTEHDILHSRPVSSYEFQFRVWQFMFRHHARFVVCDAALPYQWSVDMAPALRALWEPEMGLKRPKPRSRTIIVRDEHQRVTTVAVDTSGHAPHVGVPSSHVTPYLPGEELLFREVLEPISEASVCALALRYVPPNAAHAQVAHKTQGNRRRVCLTICPTESLSLSSPLSNNSIVHTVLPSFWKSMRAEETGRFQFELWLGHTTGDWYSNEANQHTFKMAAFSIAGDHKDKADFALSLREEAVAMDSADLTWRHNKLAKAAYEDGCEFLFHFGENDEFKEAFAARFVDELDKNHHFGVAGPSSSVLHTGRGTVHKRGMPFAFVHRLHMEIFGFTYWPWFRNVGADLWLRSVYGPRYTTWPEDIHVTSNPNNDGVSLAACEDATPSIDDAVVQGRTVLLRWLLEHPSHPNAPKKVSYVSGLYDGW